MRVDQVESCSFERWYPKFSKVTFDSLIIPIPPNVLAYLRSNDSLVLPVECDEDEEGSSCDSSSDGDEAEVVQRPHFPEFSRRVREAIAELGGEVFPKLNWSCPKDANWIGFGHSLRCTNLGQVLLLLKSSDFVAHDLTQPYKDCEDVLTCCDLRDPSYVLVLRRWLSNLNSALEFRCFVRGSVLVGISQRDTTHHFSHIAEQKTSISQDVMSFFHEHLATSQLVGLSDYVFDVVRWRKDHVQLVDLNPFGRTTDALLFDWNVLLSSSSSSPDTCKQDEPPEFRFVEAGAGIQPNNLRHYALPRDVVDAASGADPEKLVDFLKLQEEIQSSSTP